MDFRILGSLEVRHDGAVIPVRGRQQPKVLAMLLLQAGHVVSVDRLVDALWDDDPPATARRQVQNTVAALRRTLSVAEGPLITAVGEGYRLSTAHLDSLQFNDYVRQAAAAAENNRLAEAHTRLCQALELWRGEVLTGMNGRVLRAFAEQLEEARLRAFETRMDIELRLGQPGRIVEEARRLLTEHPYRQDMAALLMRALHQCGRGTEALEVYATLRSRLAEELGIDPTRALRDLHLEILRADGEGARTSAPARQSVGEVPAQLPADIAGFTGRASQLAALDAMLDQADGASVLATVAGAGGIGKTALAVHWARLRADRFPDGQLFVNLRGFDHSAPLSAHDVLTRFLRGFGFNSEAIPSDLDEAAALYRTYLHGKRVLILLDNAARVDQVRPLLPAGPGCFALVTSRDSLAGLTALDGARRVEVDTLGPRESLRLLADLIGQSRLDAEVEAATAITELCGRLPLALRVVGANLAARPSERLAEVAAELAGADRLERMVVPGDTRAAVADCITLSLPSIDENTRRFFLHLGLVPGTEISASMAAAVVDGTEAEARRLLGRLAHAHLIDPQSDEHWRFHDLVRLYAHARAADDLKPADRDAAMERLLDWYADSQTKLRHEDRVATVLALVDHPRVWKAATNFHASVHDGYDPDEIRRVVRIALGVAEAHDDAAGQAWMHNLVAGTYWAARRLPEAVAAGELALETARRSGDPLLIARHLNNMASFRSLSGDNLAARRILDESLKIAEESADPWAISARLDSLGELCIHLGQYAEAETHLRRSLAVRPPQPPGKRWPKTPSKLAHLCLDTGRYTEGLEYVELILAEAMSRHHPRALCLRASLRLAMGDLDAAYADFTESFAVERQNRYVGEAADLLIPYAHCLSERGEAQSALKHARECLEWGRSSGIRRDEAAASLLLSTIHARQEDYATAATFAREACRLFASMSEPLRHGRSLVALARALTGLGVPEAAEHRAAAEAIFERLGVTAFETR
ncbi:AfsR/SARP family transcriptional regulator [Stackebrandtia nassauensis]|uniref:Transcriptional regulator, SARP family n=1 Tax=Stackebrandtia nassauensis (strain DSM 44728 / CIP 108903 / NRRL B-16338 / NBRC 102104 / LLR-40K-21) TaxID=446470 RepID=D3PYV6_STANL|nr:BTAD domain-containing putative transcriptional regulator [Stackebrandtia nassauensis]ADD43539.1 transcriptional regulator, SARP family [Stackebrandtia nassauensis DSM 44728]